LFTVQFIINNRFSVAALLFKQFQLDIARPITQVKINTVKYNLKSQCSSYLFAKINRQNKFTIAHFHLVMFIIIVFNLHGHNFSTLMHTLTDGYYQYAWWSIYIFLSFWPIFLWSIWIDGNMNLYKKFQFSNNISVCLEPHSRSDQRSSTSQRIEHPLFRHFLFHFYFATKSIAKITQR
jgi:hypothetical protein